MLSRSRIINPFTLALAILLASVIAADAQDDGKLATKEFGDHGKTITDLGAREVARAIAIQVDGSVLVAGFTESSGNADLFLARYRRIGELDATFGSGGVTILDLGDLESAEAIAIQADGKIVVAGHSGAKGMAARFLTNGTLDLTFNGTGVVIETFTTLDGVNHSVAIQADGRIVTGGDGGANAPSWRLNRYLPDGTRDPSFGTRGDGRVFTNQTAFEGFFPTAAALGIQNDGKIVMAGTISKTVIGIGAVEAGFGVARYLPDGTLDPSFGGDGAVATEISLGHSHANAMAIRKDGKIVVGGEEFLGFAVARYETDGSLDASFDDDGIARTLMGDILDFSAEVQHLAVQDDGRIVAVGGRLPTCTGQPCDVNVAMARYLEDGSLDHSFDGDGKVITDFGPRSDAFAIAYRNDRLYVTGFIGNAQDILVAEYVADGEDGFGTIRQPITTVSCPGDVSTNTAPGVCGATINYSPATSSDPGTISCEPPPGSFFPNGATTATCTTVYGDGVQNQQLTASCTFQVTIADNEPPVLTTSVGVRQLWPVDSTLVDVGFAATASDNCATAAPASVQIYSNEPNDDGVRSAFSPDAIDIAPGTLQLRAERRGGGTGRVYLIVSRITDTAAHTTLAVTSVVVPKNLSAADVSAISAQAAVAEAFALANDGAPPAGYVLIGAK